MGTNSEFLIPYKGLENGIHNYRFQVSTDFFDNFDNAIIRKGNYQIDLIFDKRDMMMILDFSFEGQFEATCDRCLSTIDIPSKGGDQIILKTKEKEEMQEKDNVVILESDESSIDVSVFINNMLHLHLPIINERDCEGDGYKYCDHTALDKIEYGDDQSEKKSGDMWDALKDLNLD